MSIVEQKVRCGDAALQYDNDGGYQLKFDMHDKKGLSLWIVRHENSQLGIYINTEDMETDHENGEPVMNILLNNATLYDKEIS